MSKLKSTLFLGMLLICFSYANIVPAPAYDLPTSCAPVRTIDQPRKDLMVAEITNSCGVCALIDANWTFNGQIQAPAGFWPPMQPGEAKRMYIPLNLGLGDYKVFVARVATCG